MHFTVPVATSTSTSTAVAPTRTSTCDTVYTAATVQTVCIHVVAACCRTAAHAALDRLQTCSVDSVPAAILCRRVVIRILSWLTYTLCLSGQAVSDSVSVYAFKTHVIRKVRRWPEQNRGVIGSNARMGGLSRCFSYGGPTPLSLFFTLFTPRRLAFDSRVLSQIYPPIYTLPNQSCSLKWNRFPENVFLIVQYKCFKASSGGFYSQESDPPHRIMRYWLYYSISWFFHFQLTEYVSWKWFVWGVLVKISFSTGPDINYFYMIHRGGRKYWRGSFFRILPLRCGSPYASTEVGDSPRPQSPLHFDIRNI